LKVVCKNRKASFSYELIDRYEAGIVLEGSEVKAIRAGKVNIKDGFVKFIRGEAFIFGMHISHLETANPHFKPDEKRARKLLMHRKEIDKLIGKIAIERLAFIPTRLYFSAKNRLKVEVYLAKGKNVADKRETIKKREADIQTRRAIKGDY
jgi:SsrA-binding protein